MCKVLGKSERKEVTGYKVVIKKVGFNLKMKLTVGWRGLYR